MISKGGSSIVAIFNLKKGLKKFPMEHFPMQLDGPELLLQLFLINRHLGDIYIETVRCIIWSNKKLFFGPNYFWTKLYTIENFGFRIKLFFGPNEPYRILDQIILGPNYFGPNYTHPLRVTVDPY